MQPEELMTVNGNLFLSESIPNEQGEGARRRIIADILRLGLERHAWELDVDGVTVLRPDEVAPQDFLDRVRDALVKSVSRQAGIEVDVRADGSAKSRVALLEKIQTGSGYAQAQNGSGILADDPVFEQILMHEPTITLISYLLGESCTLSFLAGGIKGPGKTYLPLHSDQNQMCGPAPFPPYAQVANATWVLSDYDEKNGGICFVRGSHRLCRNPTAQEATDLDLFEPLEVPSGSVIIWHGNTWHGAFRRSRPGVRLSLLTMFTRWYLHRYENFAKSVTKEMLARNPDRLATLLGIRPLDPKSDRMRAITSSCYA